MAMRIILSGAMTVVEARFQGIRSGVGWLSGSQTFCAESKVCLSMFRLFAGWQSHVLQVKKKRNPQFNCSCAVSLPSAQVLLLRLLETALSGPHALRNANPEMRMQHAACHSL